MPVPLRLLAQFLTLMPIVGCHAQPAAKGPGAPLALERTIPLGAVAGRIDHLAIDVAHHRLFIAELGAGSVEAVDIARGAAGPHRRAEGAPGFGLFAGSR